eukprot:COSAG01_NODE_16213_length_1259_cov_1.439655_1_plen_53_part_10
MHVCRLLRYLVCLCVFKTHLSFFCFFSCQERAFPGILLLLLLLLHSIFTEYRP